MLLSFVGIFFIHIFYHLIDIKFIIVIIININHFIIYLFYHSVMFCFEDLLQKKFFFNKIQNLIKIDNKIQ